MSLQATATCLQMGATIVTSAANQPNLHVRLLRRDEGQHGAANFSGSHLTFAYIVHLHYDGAFPAEAEPDM